MAVSILAKSIKHSLPVLLGAVFLYFNETASAQSNDANQNGEISSGAISESSDEISNNLEETNQFRNIPWSTTPILDSLTEWGKFWSLVDDKTGLSMGFNYTTLYQAATKGDYKGPSNGGSGDFDIIGRWHFLKSDVTKGLINSGTIGFATEYRHKIGAVTPADLGDSLGSLWKTTSGFNEQDFSLIQWWWQQELFNEKFGFRVGKIDVSGIFDVYRFNSANNFFVNEAFSDNPAIPFPQNGFGGVIHWTPTEDIYVSIGRSDANGRKTEPTEFKPGKVEEFFSATSIGWRPEIEGLGRGHYQVTVWNTDKRSGSTRPGATGYSLILQQDLGNGWIPFARYSYADDKAVDTKQLVTLGVVREGTGRNEYDRMGAAIAWGEPFNPLYRDQWTAELFYRWALTPEFRVTPLAQIIINPAKNSRDDVIGLFGVRARLTF